MARLSLSPLALAVAGVVSLSLLSPVAAQQSDAPQVFDSAPALGQPAPEATETAPALPAEVPTPTPEPAPPPAAPDAPATAPEAAEEIPAETAPATPMETTVEQPPLPAPQALPEAPAAGPVHDLSAWGMYQAAHPVVKAVMILLVLASFVTWTVLLFKAIELRIARSRLNRSAGRIREAVTLQAAAESLGKRRDPAAFMAFAALEEFRASEAALDGAGPEGVKERVRSIVERVEVQAGERLRRGIGLLATIGSVGPFVGLFGTVWGIMNAFIGIAESQTTNLAVVAPGIAEALLATAMGLVAAIPAVVIYNHFVRSIAGWKVSLADAGAGVERMLSRDLDYRRAGQLSGREV
ncbi:tonB-system energizer ExbB [Cereibacter changlensis JA139]|uniref:Biopolymer transport protein ExbB n=2 Tax=Cereibacter changlensis TaxID=402884 RepID=A0A2T4JRG9_9RHOB|nr:tonB-system energizer ExbB [Cereibacter changlensis]PTE20498.1 tonB-system energizer ExbB [Cereibacter changlensis JA139]PZX55076.1 outer membrane transport energization protein ExbB [Cereibacter changlensis]